MLRLQIVLKMTAVNGWTITVTDHFCQIWQNVILYEMGFISPTFFLLQKRMWMDASVSPLAHVLMFLSAMCYLEGCLLSNSVAF